MRAARLIKMVLLLQSRVSMTAGELARELEVSERTVARDVLALSEAGVPVYADRGRTGGYRLIGGYRTRLTGLGRSEAGALFLSGVPSALREMGLADAASAARLKVSAALLPEPREAAAGAAQRFHLDAPGWYQEPQTPARLPLIADAVWHDRRLTARYLRKDKEVERELEPYGLVLKAGVWYLAARALPPPGEEPAGRGAAPASFRVYRVDRFTAVAADGARFTRDPAFDLPAFWEERAEQFKRAILRSEVVLRLSGRGIRQLPYVTEPAAAREAVAAAGEPDGQGLWTVTLAVEDAEVAYAQLLALGPEAEVLAPAELRERFAAAARRTAALYATEASPGAAVPR
ncbi:helix-turn-helix transcriptional regulator [Streptomyces pinistramenti]|uniref:helix-turn-helix transcriptional regulator n=1 Tax=Streptomyces pinistramenti TaxID=2884812 RepID=UPI001D08F719|nr:WYL domain-containing protein [Streptomyces pinistramenti]MCB5909639.1 WYL domain-containing protein [Streptomyces pinistramenti]